jgi:hypothetical protein
MALSLRKKERTAIFAAQLSVYERKRLREEGMRLRGRNLVLTLLFIAAFALGFRDPASGQATAAPAPVQGAQSVAPDPATTASAAVNAPNNAPKTYTVPAGTKVLLQLTSSLNTKSAQPGDGVYLSSAFPVVVGNRVMIPAGVFVQGVVDRVARAGHLRGKAQLDMHFTSMIFPNGSVVEIPGVVSGLPGASKQDVKKNGEGTIEQDKDKTRNAGKTAEIAIPTGATVGSIAGLGSGHPIAGGFGGIGAGLAAVGLVSLFTRGADVNIPSGTQVEMVFQRPLILEQENLGSETVPGGSPAMVPAANQPTRLPKPGHPNVICPPGGLGCS